MEKTMNDIIAFVKKAMSLNMKVKVGFWGTVITVDENIDFDVAYMDENHRGITIRTPSGASNEIPITNAEYNLFKVLCDEVSEYGHHKALEEFDNFFKDKEGDKKITNVDDLF